MKYVGITAREQQLIIDDFARRVRQETRRQAYETGQALKEKDVAERLGQKENTPNLAEWFVVLATEREDYLNPQYDAYLLKHRKALEGFFPTMYSQAFGKRIGIIEPEPVQADIGSLRGRRRIR